MNSATLVSSKLARLSFNFGMASAILLIAGYFTFFWLPYLGWASGLIAMFFGIKAMRQTEKLQGVDKNMANTGTAFGAISLLYFIASVIAAFAQG